MCYSEGLVWANCAQWVAGLAGSREKRIADWRFEISKRETGGLRSAATQADLARGGEGVERWRDEGRPYKNGEVVSKFSVEILRRS